MNQTVLDRAVKIATSAAMNGHPVEQIIWMPPDTTSNNPIGSFMVVPAQRQTASETPCWKQ